MMLLAALLLCPGCKSIGPDAIRGSHASYNNAIGSVMNCQLLEGIIRLRYCEKPTFLKVSGISDTWHLGMKAGFGDKTEIDRSTVTEHGRWGNLTAPTPPGGNSTVPFPTANNEKHGGIKMAPELIFDSSNSPTVSYGLLEEERFQRLTLPISLDVVLKKVSSKWKLPYVFDMCVEEMNKVENDPGNGDFCEIINLLRDLVRAKLVDIGIDQNNRFALHIEPSEEKNDTIIAFKNLLHLDQNKDKFYFETSFFRSSGDTIVVRTRSQMDLLSYLSRGMEVPKGHEDLVEAIGDGNAPINIRCSKSKPKDAFVAVRYCRHWFYIADNDLPSKKAFEFASTLFSIQSSRTLLE